MTQNIQQKHPKSFLKKSGIFCNGQVNLLISTWLSVRAFHLLKTKPKAERPTNKQLYSAAVKAWQSITKEETQSLLMSISSRLKAAIACKEKKNVYDICLSNYIWAPENEGLFIKKVVIPKHFMLHFCSTPWIKA